MCSAAGDAGTLQGLLRGEFFAHRHQTGHFGFGNADFLAAPIGQGNIGNGAISGVKGRMVAQWLLQAKFGITTTLTAKDGVLASPHRSVGERRCQTSSGPAVAPAVLRASRTLAWLRCNAPRKDKPPADVMRALRKPRRCSRTGGRARGCDAQGNGHRPSLIRCTCISAANTPVGRTVACTFGPASTT